jgi:hypothetical protein
MDFEVNRHLIGSREVVEAMKSGIDPRSTTQKLEAAVRTFIDARKPYLIY